MNNNFQNKLSTDGTKVGLLDPKEIGPSMPTGFDADQKRLRTLINRRHPEYSKRKDHWEFLRDTYEGGRDWFEKNIFQYVKEGTEEFAKRKQRCYRFNHTREVVDLVNKYMYVQEVHRNEDDVPPKLKEFWESATTHGLEMEEFSKEMSRLSSIYGRIGIVVDNNVPADTAISVADEKKLDTKCYAYFVTPLQMLDYSFDDQGQLNWILIEELYRDDSDPFSQDSGMQPRWRLWTKDSWYLFREEAVRNSKSKRIVLDSKESHNLGVVPVVIHDNVVSSEEYCSPSLIDDVAYLDRAVANYLSNLDAIIQDQTFSQLAMPAQGLMPGEKDYDKMIEIGSKRVFLYDGESGAAPTFISPDVKQAQLLVQAIEKIINEIYHSVGLAGERTKQDNSLGIDNSSGVAKAYDFERVNALLAAKAASLEVSENKINNIVCLWNDEEYEEDLIQYPMDFDTRGLYDEFDIAARLLLIEAPDEIRREQMVAVMDKLFPVVKEATRAKMESSLKNWPPEELVDPMTGAPPAKKNNRQGQVTKSTP